MTGKRLRRCPWWTEFFAAQKESVLGPELNIAYGLRGFEWCFRQRSGSTEFHSANEFDMAGSATIGYAPGRPHTPLLRANDFVATVIQQLPEKELEFLHELQDHQIKHKQAGYHHIAYISSCSRDILEMMSTFMVYKLL